MYCIHYCIHMCACPGKPLCVYWETLVYNALYLYMMTLLKRRAQVSIYGTDLNTTICEDLCKISARTNAFKALFITNHVQHKLKVVNATSNRLFGQHIYKVRPKSRRLDHIAFHLNLPCLRILKVPCPHGSFIFHTDELRDIWELGIIKKHFSFLHQLLKGCWNSSGYF